MTRNETFKSVKRTYSNIAFLVFVVFLVLKLTSTIDWSWWMVTLPLWIGAAAALAVFIVGYLLALAIVPAHRAYSKRSTK